ncbi:hypothetical protein PEBR_15454 [Penicillium brasilianum]|uniref:Uncharacterized protein n=1 Tax=Penicillium brasilianum TaxID=104259 RepID=A0A1S9RQ94_PENBI|nr:hypothetical protein PEBR_15454 [Penicillium brasilianum]
MAEEGIGDTPSVQAQDTPMPDQAVTDSSASTVVSPPETALITALPPMELSSTEGPSTGTTCTVDMVTPASQAEHQADEFLEAMSAALSQGLNSGLVQGQGQASSAQELQEAPVNTQLPRPSSDLVQEQSQTSPAQNLQKGSDKPKLPSQGQISFRETPMAHSSVPTPSRTNAQTCMPGSMKPKKGLLGPNLAETSRMTALLPETFQTQLVLRGAPNARVLPRQSSGMAQNVPASGAWNGFGSTSYGAPSRQTPFGEPLKPVEEGEIRRPQANLTSVPQLVPGMDGQHDDDQITLGSLVLENLSDHDTLFYFGALCIMARLNPQFLFKYGGRNGKQVGARLVMYGHTILVAPDLDSASMVRAVACRQALIELRKYHPDWMVPPLPVNGVTQPQWNWVNLLGGFCEQANWPALMYNTAILGNQWHSEVGVKGFYFRTFKGCGSMSEAQNTVSHHALHQLLVMDDIDVANILPVNSPMLVFPEAKKPVTPLSEEAIRNRSRLLLDAIGSLRSYPGETSKSQSLQSTVDALNSRLRKDEIKQPGTISGLSGGKISKKPVKPAKPGQKKGEKKPAIPPTKPKSRLPPPPPPPPQGRPPGWRRGGRSSRRSHGRLSPHPQPKAKGKIKVVDGSRPKTPPGNANLVPLENARLDPMEMEVELVVDPLVTLKAIQDGLQTLSPHASFLRLMKKMCFVLKIKEPEIRCTQAVDNSSSPMYAHFDDPNPYLVRASPVFLANGRWADEEAARSLGVKKIILFLLNMCKDEVDMGVLEARWEIELKFLSKLEREIEDRVHLIEN